MNKTVTYFGPLGPGTQAPIGGQAPQTSHWGRFAPPNLPEFRGGPEGPPHTPYIGGLKPNPPWGAGSPPDPPAIYEGAPSAPSNSPFK